MKKYDKDTIDACKDIVYKNRSVFAYGYENAQIRNLLDNILQSMDRLKGGIQPMSLSDREELIP